MSIYVSKSCRDAENVDDGDESWRMPLAFNKLRHTSPIEGLNFVTNTWRMMERMKTVSVALVLCLNVGVDPPDVVKTQPCARLECWIDPLSMSPQKALETIGSNLQKQYERWQSRARYKQSLDPTVEEVKKLCTSLRRNAKEERVLFHYNGHGVPKPTTNGEIWVFNRTYTQYIPLSIYDLQTWMDAPSIYVYDCSNAGIIVEAFQQFAEQHEKEYETEKQNLQNRAAGSPNVTVPSYKNCIQLAACQSNQILPMNPDLPADVFTSCLTTPIKIALRWFLLQNSSKLVPRIPIEHIDKIPGVMSDRKTVLGELNWILTAVTDTIAWNTLPRELFQKLFRQDLLVASLFRNFLLAERILRSYDCTPVSSPKLPPTYQHPMWQAWDMALDFYISKFPINPDCGEKFEHAPFFEDQLTAFEVWLSLASKSRNPPEQLPVILQVLLAQSHRLKALELLGRFLDLGPWAVNLALNVGIFPYILKLLQSVARELRSPLVFIWAKILAVDNSCQTELVKENGHKYFLSFLQDCTIPSESRLYAAFALACIVHNFPQGQNAALQGSLVSICLEQLGDPNPQLRQWLCLCLARLWHNYDKARWCGVRDIAHEKLYTLLQDPVPEVRASSVYALGTFINSVTKRSEHANNIDQIIAMTLINTVSHDMCPLVRKELVVALQWMVLHFENLFVTLADKIAEENSRRELVVETMSPFGGMRRINSRDRLKMLSPSNNDTVDSSQERIVRVSSSSSISSLGLSSLGNLPKISYGSVYVKLWNGLTSLDNDPHPGVASLSQKVTNYIRNQVKDTTVGKETLDGKLSSSLSLPPSPSNRTNYYLSNSKGESPPATASSTTDLIRTSRGSAQIGRPRKLIPNTVIIQILEANCAGKRISEESDEGTGVKSPLVKTNFVDWCCAQFAQPVNCDSETELMKDVESKAHHERDWRLLRNKTVRLDSREEHLRVPHGKIDTQIFHTRSPQSPDTITFHPFEQHVAIACKDYFGIWDWKTGSRLTYCPSRGPNKVSRITSLEFLNSYDIALLLAGSDDGSIRVWKNYYNMLGPTAEPTLLTAWQALSDVQTSKNSLGSAGLVTKWEQRSLSLAVGGDVRMIRIFDMETENKKYDIPTGADCCTTCLDTDELGNMMVIGCGDGSVRMFDRRLPPSEAKVSTWREHSSWILGVSLRKCDSSRPLVVTGSSSGEIKYFDLRKNNAVNVIQTSPSISAFAVHEYADVFACSSTNQSIHVHNFEGQHMNTIKLNEGFIGNRSASPASCLSFHPYKVILAAGSIDNSIVAYSSEPRRKLLDT